MCIVNGCEKGGYHRKGLCPMHYNRQKKHGSVHKAGTANGAPMAFVLKVLSAPKIEDCITWPFARDAAGYAKMRFEGSMKNAHRLVCKLKHGEPAKVSLMATHTCGNGSGGCINPHHLEWGTGVKNSMDRAGHGTHNRGGRHYLNRLNETQVLEIYTRKGQNAQAVADDYGVTRGAVRNIWSGKSWHWLTGEPRRLSNGQLSAAL